MEKERIHKYQREPEYLKSRNKYSIIQYNIKMAKYHKHIQLSTMLQLPLIIIYLFFVLLNKHMFQEHLRDASFITKRRLVGKVRSRFVHHGGNYLKNTSLCYIKLSLVNLNQKNLCTYPLLN